MLRAALISAIVIYAPMVAIHGYCITGNGGWDISGVEIFALGPLTALFVTIGSAFAMIFPKTREKGFHTFIFCAVLLALSFPAFWTAFELRSYGFYLVTQRAKPLISSIESYVKDQGAPPETIQELVPTYLSAIPGGLPELSIVTGSLAREQFGGNEWALDSIVSTGIINWDRFIYFPNQRYPERGYGGSIERIERWIYVHE